MNKTLALYEHAIDFVLYWVDGNDPAHRKRRNSYLNTFALEDENNAEQSTDDRRFVGSGELQYCLRSIVNNAPWYHKIYLITDDQIPDFLNPKQLAQYNIEFISHRELFAGCPQYLPTFNSRAITSRLHHIEKLSDTYIVGNDDIMLGPQVTPEFFFCGTSPVIYADWISKHQRPSGLHQQGIIAGANMMGFSETRFLMPSHGFLPFYKPHMHNLEKAFVAQFDNNLRHKFRHESQFLVESLYNHYCVKHLAGTLRDTQPMVHFSCELCRQGTVDKILFLLDLIKNGQRKMFCINEFDSLVSRIPEVYSYLEEICGEKLLCEISYESGEV